MAENNEGTTKEVAKTINQVAKVTEKLGRFMAKILGEPLQDAAGMLADRVKYVRWEQQIRLVDRCEEIIKSRHLEGKTIPAPPKAIIPIFELASLESDPELHELWAQLLTSFADPDMLGKVRTAFIDIIKQLEPIDAKTLQVIYTLYQNRYSTNLKLSPSQARIDKQSIRNEVKMDLATYEATIDNLIRVRCIASYVSNDTIDIDLPDDSISADISFYQGYDAVCITALGMAFVESCGIRAF